MGDFYTFTNVELVRIGEGQAAVVRVTATAIDYVNEEGARLRVDLDECRRMFRALEIVGEVPPRNESDWAGAFDVLPKSEQRKSGSNIGFRARMDDPPWFQFCNRRRTQFMFRNVDEMNALLMDPLAKNGGAAGSFDCS